MAIGTYMSVVTLNVYGLNAPTKDTDWLNDYKKPTSDLKTHIDWKWGWKNIFHVNGKQKKAGVAILISDKTDLKIEITRDKEGHYIMIKGSIQYEDLTIVNIYIYPT